MTTLATSNVGNGYNQNLQGVVVANPLADHPGVAIHPHFQQVLATRVTAITTQAKQSPWYHTDKDGRPVAAWSQLVHRDPDGKDQFTVCKGIKVYGKEDASDEEWGDWLMIPTGEDDRVQIMSKDDGRVMGVWGSGPKVGRIYTTSTGPEDDCNTFRFIDPSSSEAWWTIFTCDTGVKDKQVLGLGIRSNLHVLGKGKRQQFKVSLGTVIPRPELPQKPQHRPGITRPPPPQAFDEPQPAEYERLLVGAELIPCAYMKMEDTQCSTKKQAMEKTPYYLVEWYQHWSKLSEFGGYDEVHASGTSTLTLNSETKEHEKASVREDKVALRIDPQVKLICSGAKVEGQGVLYAHQETLTSGETNTLATDAGKQHAQTAQGRDKRLIKWALVNSYEITRMGSKGKIGGAFQSWQDRNEGTDCAYSIEN